MLKTVLFCNQFLEFDDLDTLGLLLRSFWQSFCFILCQECQGYPFCFIYVLISLILYIWCNFCEYFFIFSIFGGFVEINNQFKLEWKDLVVCKNICGFNTEHTCGNKDQELGHLLAGSKRCLIIWKETQLVRQLFQRIILY